MRNIGDLFGTNTKIFQAAMGGIGGPELAASVSNAGGIGHLGCIRKSAAEIRNWIRETRTLTDQPFGVNLVPKGPGPDGFEAQLSVVLEEKPKVLSLFWGDFSHVIPRAKAVGIVTIVQVGSVKEAQKALADGADIIVAQGIESGGHVRGTLGLISFLPAVIQLAGSTPVLAAGGIADHKGVLAAMSLGASGVWVGTRFIATTESLAHDIYKKRLVEAGTDDSVHGHFYSFGWRIGTPYRVIRPCNNSLFRFVAGGARHGDKNRYAEGISLYSGQGVGSITKILSAADVVSELTGNAVPKASSPVLPKGARQTETHRN